MEHAIVAEQLADRGGVQRTREVRSLAQPAPEAAQLLGLTRLLDPSASGSIRSPRQRSTIIEMNLFSCVEADRVGGVDQDRRVGSVLDERAVRVGVDARFVVA